MSDIFEFIAFDRLKNDKEFADEIRMKSMSPEQQEAWITSQLPEF